MIGQYEASGTGSIKFLMNGCLLLATADGSTNEIIEEIGAENMNMKVSVGNGIKTHLWKEVWVGDTPLMTRFPSLFALEKVKNCTINERVEMSDGGARWLWEWKRPINSQREQQELSELHQLINTTRLSNKEDIWLWMGQDLDPFSTKSLRRAIELNRGGEVDVPNLWLHWVPMNIRCFVWKASLGQIAAKSELIKRGVFVENADCSRCIGNPETVNHILFQCPFSSRIWEEIERWTGYKFDGSDTVRGVMENINAANICKKLYEKGHRTLDELKNDTTLTNSQRLGLKYFEDIRTRIPRDEENLFCSSL